MGEQDVTLYQLRVLAAVVEHGSFTGAGEALHLSQPAVSAHIRHLRRFAGAPILVRDGRRVSLTEAGRAVYRYAGEMLGATASLRRDLEEIAGGSRDYVVVATTLTYSTYLLPPLLSAFQLAHPEMRLSLVDAATGEAAELVRAGSADIGIVVSGRTLGSNLADLLVAHLCEDELVIAESGERPFSLGKRLSLEELSEIPFVEIKRTGSSAEVPLNSLLLTMAGFRPARTAMEFSTAEGTREAVRAGVGVALKVRSAIRHDLDAGILAVVELAESPLMRLAVDLICSPHRREGRTSKVFQDLLVFLQQEVPRALSGRD